MCVCVCVCNGQVLESQLLATMQTTTEHVLLIGDHQQLRPKVNSYHLERTKNLCVSMFERLTLRGIPSVQLTTQRRMRPTISQFVRPLYTGKFVPLVA